MRTICSCVFGLFVLAPLAAQAAEDLTTPPPPPDTIHGGEAATTCAWPTAVMLGGCSGTLVHPEIVIYAAHCGTPGTVRFGEYGNGPSVSAQCRTNPGYDDTTPTDWAICKLSQPVNLPVTPILYGCELDMLGPGTPVVQAGFGATSDAGGFGVKYWVDSFINNVEEGVLTVGGNGIGACPGDSGGPLFIELEDGSWRTCGITSTYSGTCGSINHYSRPDEAVPWFESQFGIDLTPCHDSDTGEWDPGSDCMGFYAGGSQGSGTWNDGGPCLGTPASGPSDSCGDPLGAEEDPPTVAITYPADGDHFDTAPVDLDVTIDADDGDGVGVETVRLEIDGTDLGVEDTSEPWGFDGVNFPEGEYTLVAVAVDGFENEGRSAEVTIYVGVDPPGQTDTGDSSGSGDDGDDGSDTDGDDGTTDGIDEDDGSDTEGPTDDGTETGVGENDDKGCGCGVPGRAAPWSMLIVLLGLSRRRR